MKKYEKTYLPEEGLYRIRALVDIPRHGVKAGDLGGWIEGEHNLMHTGDCWVHGQATVYHRAKVSGNALVSGRAMVGGYAQVYGNAMVGGCAYISDWARVGGSAKVESLTTLKGHARVLL